jgi:PIN domain nuclease of toxin-antitoxin system
VRMLLDTHAFLWFVLNDPRLSAHARSLMTDGESELLLSVASYWELAIKISLGKYALDQDFAVFMEKQVAENALSVLPITVQHAAVVAALPFHHRDPFDRLLVAQAMVERVPLLSADADLDAYPVTRIW